MAIDIILKLIMNAKKNSHSGIKLILTVFVLLFLINTVFAVPVAIHSATAGVITIPRYKIFQSQTNPNEIWAAFPNGSSGNNFIKTINGGTTWTAASTSMHVQGYFSDHASVGGDELGNVYIVDRANGFPLDGCAGGGLYVFFRKVNYPGESVSDFGPQMCLNVAFPGINYYTPNVLVLNSTQTWVIQRSSGYAPGNIYSVRTTNGGASWSSPQLIYSSGATDVRIGSLIIDGKPAVILQYISSVGSPNIDYRYFIWNEAQQQFVANPDSIAVSGRNLGYQREFAMSFVNNEMHIVYRDGTQLRHAWKTYNNGQTNWNDTVIESLSYSPSGWHPSLTKHGNDLYIIYIRQETSTDGTNNVYYRKFNFGSHSWGSATAMTTNRTGNQFPHGPAIASPSSTFIPVIWNQGGQIWFDKIPTTPCTTGQTQACTTTQNCAGTQTCASGTWGTCNDTPNDGCPVCNNGTTQNCTTSQSCPGTQTCVNYVWGSCTDITGDGCPVCTNGQTQSCTINSCPGTQTCVNNAWASCTDVPNDGCPSIPVATITANRVTPTSDSNKTQNQAFTFTTTVTCNTLACGNVTAVLDPIIGNNLNRTSAYSSGPAKRCGIFYLNQPGTMQSITRYGSAATGGQCATAIYSSTTTTP
ncbi:MAG: hypothetical protein ABH986_05105, partial [archaeon]